MTTIIDLTAITTPFGLLDEATQKALRDDGGPYQFYGGSDKWMDCNLPGFCLITTYRKKPAPKIETVVLYGLKSGGHWIFGEADASDDTHSITMTLTEGVPNPVAKVEVLK